MVIAVLAMNRSYWLLKTEPDECSYDDIERKGVDHWTGVRNFQARNFMRKMKKGDLALVYHTGDQKAVVGVAEISKEAYDEPVRGFPAGSWSQVDVVANERLSRAVSLAELKSRSDEFKGFLLLKQSRLSVMPVEPEHFKKILKLGSKKPGP